MRNPENRETIILRAGLWGGPLFIVSLLVFGALTPGYSHLRQPISELGGWGMPWGLWFDLFGLFIPGMLAAGVAFVLRLRLQVLGVKTRWATGLVIFGAMFALTAVPADFSRMFQSPWTWVHAFFVFGDVLVWFVVVPGCTKALKALGASATSARVFFIFGHLVAAEFFLYAAIPNTPGLVQRLMILTIHVAISWMSWTMLRLPRARPD